MKVALLGAYPLVFEELGAQNTPKFMTSWLVSLAGGLAKLDDMEIHFIAITSSIAGDRTIRSGNVTIHFLKYPKRTRVPTFFQYNKMRIHRKLREIKPDIVHGHGTEQEYAYIAVTSGFPAIITVHNIVFELLKELSDSISMPKFYALKRTDFYALRAIVSYKILSYFENYTLKVAKHVIGTTPYMKTVLGGLVSGTFHILDNSINEIFFDVRQSQEEDKRLLFVGMIRPEKGLLNLAKAVNILRDRHTNIMLRIAGSIPSSGEAYYSRITAYISENHLASNVEFLGYKEPEDIAREISECTALVLPSTHEPFGCVLAEAMAMGKPVVATRVGGVPYVVKDGETGFLVEPGDPKALADKIAMILNDRELRVRMGKNGKEEALTRFHPDSIARKTRTIYEQVLAEWRS